MLRKLTDFSTKHPKTIILITIIVTFILSLMIVRIRIDTDPENMLSENESVRVFHNDVKNTFSLHDMLVLGIVNDSNPDGVFNPGSLKKIHELTKYITSLEGVIEEDVLAPSVVDNIEQGGPGSVRFEWLMPSPPKDRKEALEIKRKVTENPLFFGTLVSENGKALCIYIPIEEKKISYRLSKQIREKIQQLGGPEQFFITGLPVAEDTFGVEMFIQMAICAPLAGLVVFLLMWFFFKKIILVFSPMIVAIMSILSTMGLLIGTGNTVHIMSSMIPIFLMPIAVVDSVHILSEFFDRCRPGQDRCVTVKEIMGKLFTPMLYTSLTSAVGFASLALTPIPPVQIFGIFVAIGIMLAWVLTITFIPAYIMIMPQKTIDKFGIRSAEGEKKTILTRLLHWTGNFTYRRAKPILVITAIILAISIYGISRIKINDNPVKWFNTNHPIRKADSVLNEHFGGTYMAYLVLSDVRTKEAFTGFLKRLSDNIHEMVKLNSGSFPELERAAVKLQLLISKTGEKFIYDHNYSIRKFLAKIKSIAERNEDTTTGDLQEAWSELSLFIDEKETEILTFKNPAMLTYLEKLQQELMKTGAVGKTTSVTDIVKKVYQELMGGGKEFNLVPNTSPAIAQCLISFQNSHKPNFLWHMVTPYYDQASIWIQLKSGDNKDMETVTRKIEEFFKDNPPPIPVTYNWAGLTYLNVVWQNKMVWGMLRSFLGSFIIVLIMMIFLFRSILWGLLSMIPLTVTITFIYGLIGLAGKDYNMPIAVLSALTLGLSVDFAIHFIQRTRTTFRETGSWQKTCMKMFGEPAVAISRNAIVIALGFLPLLAAPLIPYKTVGFFLASIMAISGLGTLLILPSLITLFKKILFRKSEVKNMGLK